MKVGGLRSMFWLVWAVSMTPQSISSFVMFKSICHSNNQLNMSTGSAGDAVTSSKTVATRRRFLQKELGFLIFGGLPFVVNSSPALAKEEEVELPTREVVTSTFNAIRFEVEDPEGGVAIMQSRIDAKDWDGLMEFTKGYDLELRKLRMGKAKKLLQDKDIKSTGTEFANAVTFDLIGINRSSRKGQESVDSANKYLQELRDDVGKFLELEKTIEVQ